jgi:hypothetical protein
VFNPIQLVEKRRMYIPYIRNQYIIWYKVTMATVNGPSIDIMLPEWKMMSVVHFRQAKKAQHPRAVTEYIGSDGTLLRYLEGARRWSHESFDGGITWKEVLWGSLT